MTPAELEAAIRAVGAERYHDKHPFHRLLHGGKLDKGQVQAWALNRYCYQSGVPRKDAALMSRVHDRELRREWIHRMLDHDGAGGEEGGIERWLVLTDALGLDRAYVVSMQGALPATRFAVEAYVNFVRERTLLEAVASSLTELFAPSIHRERIAGMLENYDFVGEQAMHPFAAQVAVVHTAHQGRVLTRHARLIAVAVERPGLHLALVELAAVQQAVEGVLVVVALGADRADGGLELGRGHEAGHRPISMPSKAISQPARSTWARSGLSSRRTGLELFMCT